jgi:hypothetical protein
MQWPGTELTASGMFVDVRQSTTERRTMMAANDYVGHLSTVSAYLRLPEPVRREALDAILEVLPRIPRAQTVRTASTTSSSSMPSALRTRSLSGTR